MTSEDSALARARRRLDEGRPDLAELACRALADWESRADALHMMGRIRIAQSHPEAVGLLERARAHWPHDATVLADLGAACLVAGDHDRARSLVGDAIGRKPDCAEVLVRAGEVHAALSEIDDAMRLFDRAAELDPANPDAHLMRGMCLHHLGRVDDALPHLLAGARLRRPNAEVQLAVANVLCRARRWNVLLEHLDEALAANPNNVDLEAQRANVLLELERSSDALASARRCVEIASGSVLGAATLAQMLVVDGRFDEALRLAHDGLPRCSHDDPALATFCAVLIDAGQPDEAIAHLRPALARALRHAELNLLMADATKRTGDMSRSSVHVARAIAGEYAWSWQWHRLFDVMADSVLPTTDEAVRARLAACFDVLRYDKQQLATAACAALLDDPAVTALARVDDEHLVNAVDQLSGVSLRLFCNVLANVLVISPALERLLTRIRRAIALHSANRPSDKLVDVAAAIAMQCFNNEHVWLATDNELDQVATSLDGSPLRLAITGMYQPLHRIPTLADMRRRSWPPSIERLLVRAFDEPCAEAEIRIESLQGSSNAISDVVRAQYESNPYPRWLDIGPQPSWDLDAFVKTRIPYASVPPLSTAAPKVLIAGCGTGRHALLVARRIRHADVTAIDLSTTSLRYASRKARELGIDRVRFFQADILDLSLPRFDVVESVGVLHHMEEPERGWARLVEHLRPGGLMCIGLYSAAARECVTHARAFIAAEGLGSSNDDIRVARERILVLPRDHPVAPVALSPDFFSTSGCRDLLFHVQEQCFTVSRIQRAIQSLGLRFLGFEVPRSYAAAFRDHFPGASLDDLDRWHDLECELPSIFAGMYVFWCLRPS